MEQQLIKKQSIKNKILPHTKKLKKALVISIFSFLISRLAITNGISPFAQSFLLATGCKPFTLIISLLGVLTGSTVNKHKYICILLLSFTIFRFLKGTTKKGFAEKAAPYILSGSSAIFGMIYVLFNEYVIFDILLVILDSFLSAVFYYIVKNFLWITEPGNTRRCFTSEEFTAPLVILCVIIAGIGNFDLPFNISFKNIVCIYTVFVTSMYANIGISAEISVFMGIASGIGMDYFYLYLAYFPMNTLFCSVFSKYGKIASVLGFTTGNIIISVLLGEARYMVISFTDIAIASVLFALTPEKLLGRLNFYFNRSTKQKEDAYAIKNIATVKLSRLSDAFRKLAETIHTDETENSSKINSEVLYNSVFEKVCKSCSLRFYCWDKEHKKTHSQINTAITKLKEKGFLEPCDFSDSFLRKCTKSPDIINTITSAYEILRLNTVWENRVNENVRIYKEQFSELSEILNNLKSQIDRNPFFDENLTTEIIKNLESKGILVKNFAILKDSNDRYEADITLFPCNNTAKKCYNSVARAISDAVGIPFIKVHGNCSFKECRLYFTEAEIYELETAVRQLPKKEKEPNGDSWNINLLDNGSKYLAICDGSGSGNEAKLYSERTIKLLDKFLKTGFSKASSVKLINSSFINSDIKESSSTVDLSIIDLKNGQLDIIKKGASPTYILRADGECEVISSNTLPLGVFGGEKGKIKKSYLAENDIIVMASDGVCDAIDKEDWIIDALYAMKSKNPEDIATTLLKIAVSAKGADDDKTVIVSKLLKNA